MPIDNFSGNTFVSFLDISGFKELMKDDDKRALEALSRFYKEGYNSLDSHKEINGLFVSDCAVLFAKINSVQVQLEKLLIVIKEINKAMLQHNNTLTTSIAYGNFDYHDKLEFDGIEKNPIYGSAYVKAFLDNVGSPKIQPGQCRLINENLPANLNLNSFNLLKKKRESKKHFYFYWNLNMPEQIEPFEQEYSNSYNLKYTGMLHALKKVY